MKKAIILILFMISVYFFSVYTHELVHKTIAEKYGCIKPNIDMIKHKFFCYEYEERKEDIKQQETKLHLINEIIGYPLHLLINLVSVIFFIREVKNDRRK